MRKNLSYLMVIALLLISNVGMVRAGHLVGTTLDASGSVGPEIIGGQVEVSVVMMMMFHLVFIVYLLI